MKYRIFRRSWPMTKKQYKTPNVSVGTVKKSIAAIDGEVVARAEPAIADEERGFQGPNQPSTGCWEIAAKYRDQKLNFVVSVQP